MLSFSSIWMLVLKWRSWKLWNIFLFFWREKKKKYCSKSRKMIPLQRFKWGKTFSQFKMLCFRAVTKGIYNRMTIKWRIYLNLRFSNISQWIANTTEIDDGIVAALFVAHQWVASNSWLLQQGSIIMQDFDLIRSDGDGLVFHVHVTHKVEHELLALHDASNQLISQRFFIVIQCLKNKEEQKSNEYEVFFYKIQASIPDL